MNISATIVVIDDDAMSRELLAFQLKFLKFDKVYLFERGVDALAWLTINPYSTILVDCQMPQMDGCEVTRRIRENEHRLLGSSLVERHTIFAMSVDGNEVMRKRCAEAGTDGYLVKPIKISQLSSALADEISPEHNKAD